MLVIYATTANAEIAYAPKIPVIGGSTLQTIENTTLVATKQPLRAGLVEWEVITAINEVVASNDDYKGLNDVLYNLAKCEDGFHNQCIIDTNGLLSCGVFMYQQKTYERFCEGNYGDKNIRQQTECAAKMISGGGWHNWYNCLRPVFGNITQSVAIK